jgi:hypothetical protein
VDAAATVVDEADLVDESDLTDRQTAADSAPMHRNLPKRRPRSKFERTTIFPEPASAPSAKPHN